MYTSVGKMEHDKGNKKSAPGKEREQVARGAELTTTSPAPLPVSLNTLNQRMNKLAEFRDAIQRQIEHANRVHARIESRRVAVSN